MTPECFGEEGERGRGREGRRDRGRGREGEEREGGMEGEGEREREMEGVVREKESREGGREAGRGSERKRGCEMVFSLQVQLSRKVVAVSCRGWLPCRR